MSLATADDANVHLDKTKVKFTDAADALEEASEADVIVKSLLYDAYPTLVTTWDATPGAGQTVTPAAVRLAASLLMASYRYSRKYSEQTTKTSNYAKLLEDRAMMLLAGVNDGTALLYDVLPLPEGPAFSRNDFWPNDLTGSMEPLDARRISMSQEF